MLKRPLYWNPPKVFFAVEYDYSGGKKGETDAPKSILSRMKVTQPGQQGFNLQELVYINKCVMIYCGLVNHV